MPNKKDKYKDISKWEKTTYEQRRRYYTRRRLPPSPWEEWQDVMVLEHSMPDTELAPKIGHGVGAIQVRRCMLKKGKVENGNV